MSEPHTRLGRARLVEQPVGCAAQATGRIGGARRVRFGLQDPQARAGQRRAQGLATHAVALLAQGHP